MMNNKIKINKKELLSALKKDLQAASTFREDEDIKIARRVSEYQGKPYGNEQKGKSAIVSLDIKRQSEWAHAALVDPFVGATDVIKCTPVTWEDREAARQNELLLNTQFCRQFDRYNFMTNAIKVLDMEATCVIQTGWEYEDEQVEVEREIVEVDEITGEEYIAIENIEETKVLTNRPTAVVRRNEDVYVDPTCMGDHDKMQFVIVRYETDLSTLKQDGRYKNLDKIQVGSEDANSHDDYETKYSKISSFTFEDNPRKKMVMYEYWGNYDINDDGIAEPIVCAWVGSTVIRLELNPYPDKKPPFIIVPFNKIPFEIYGESNADLISDNQKIKTAITRGIIDNMNQSNNGMIGIKKGALDPGNREKFMKGKPFEFNGSPNDFWQGSFNNIPGSAFDMLALMNNEIESITGIKSFSGGITGSSLGGTATGARGALDATSTRRLNIVRNIAENLVKPLMRKWMAYNSEFLEESEVVRITNEEFVEVRRDDLAGKIDIDITVSTQEDNAARAQELGFLLQTLGSSLPFDMTRMIMAEIAKLSKLPTLEKQILEYKQEPDPVQQKMQELQLAKLEAEIQRLKADAMNKIASSQENDADKEEKVAQAMLKRAQARKAESEADMLDITYLKIDEQIDEQTALEKDLLKFEMEMERKQFDALHQLNIIDRQITHGSKNEQIGVGK